MGGLGAGVQRTKEVGSWNLLQLLEECHSSCKQEEMPVFSPPTFQFLTSASHQQRLKRKLGGKEFWEMWFADSQTQHHRVEVRRVGLAW